MTLSPGTRLGPYEILAQLGAGGMGEVYRARDSRLGRDVALKVVKPLLATDPDRLSRFEKEARAAAHLDHPNILVVHDVGTYGDIPFIVSELLQGESLREKLDAPLSPKKAVDYTIQIAHGLAAAHEKGIVHRDIKPENVFVTKDGRVKILDFGIAKLLPSTEAAGVDTATLTATATQPGTAIGTVAYMSPEQVRGQPVDARSDLFSLGVVLYEMLSGKRPFLRDTPAEIMTAILREEPPDLTETNRGVPAALEKVVRHCLEKETVSRFHSARDVVFALEALPEVSSALPVTPMSPTGVWLHRHRRSLTGAALLLVALAVTGIFLWPVFHRSGAGGIKRVAVLPFENQGVAEDGYFADGMTDEVRSKLTGLHGLAVTASASANQYRATTKPPEQIAKELGVGYLLMAKVQRQRAGQASRIRVTPELVEVGSGGAPTARWQEAFDADLSDVFRVQGEIATKVAESLEVVLTGIERSLLEARPTSNLAAYDAYLKGKESTRTGYGRRAAVTFDEKAVALDPRFALAWATLSLHHSWIFATMEPSAHEAEEARVAAERAVELAPGLPESKLALALYYARIKKDVARAHDLLSQALETSPRNAELLSVSSWFEQDPDKALELLYRGETLDPRSTLIQRDMADRLIALRRGAEARVVCNRGLAIDPKHGDLVEAKARTYIQEGDVAGARAVVAAVPKDVAPTTLAAWFGSLDWLLDDEQHATLCRLTPAAFDDDRVEWGMTLAQAWSRTIDTARVTEYAEEARKLLAARIKQAPDDVGRRLQLALSLAYLGKRGEAVREGERAVALRAIAKNSPRDLRYIQLELVRIHILCGNQEKALDLLEPLLKAPFYLTPGWLRVDPTFEPLRKNPRFQKLVAGAK